MSTEFSRSISIMRLIALLCIIFHHSICVYIGWPPNLDVNLGVPESIQFISNVCKGIGLVAFCFISGMLVTFSFNKIIRNVDKVKGCRIFIIKKFKRLVIPALIWGLMYAVLFNDYMLSGKFPNFINGTHLWFLPMLFLLMISVLPVFFNKFLWIIPCALFCLFHYHYFLRTTAEYVLYFPSFACGILYYEQIKKNIDRRFFSRILKLWPIGLSVLLYLSLSRYYDIAISYCIYLLVIVVIIYTFNKFSKYFTKVYENKVIKFATKQSFTIYIVHQFVIILVSFIDLSILYSASLTSITLYFVATFCGSLIIAYIVLVLKERYSVLEYVC